MTVYCVNLVAAMQANTNAGTRPDRLLATKASSMSSSSDGPSTRQPPIPNMRISRDDAIICTTDETTDAMAKKVPRNAARASGCDRNFSAWE